MQNKKIRRPKYLKDSILVRVLSILSKRRKKQLILLMILIVINGFFESFAVISLLPFLSIITNPESIFSIEIFKNSFLFLGINSSENIILPITLFFTFLVCISYILKLLTFWSLNRFVALVDIDFSTSLFKKNLNQSYADHIKQNSSEIIGLVLDQSGAAASAIKQLLSIVVSIFMTLSILFSLIIISWKIVLLSSFFFIIYYLFILLKSKSKFEKGSSLVSSLENRRIQVIQESFGGFRDIIINRSQDLNFRIFKEYQSKLRFAYAKMETFVLLPRYSIEALIVIIGAWLGFIFTSSNQNNINFIPLLGTYTFGILKLLPNVQLVYTSWARYKFKFESLKKFIIAYDKTKYEVINKPIKSKIIFKDTIGFKNVCFKYETDNNMPNIFSNTNFVIKKGDHIGIIGKTGSGKSTLLDLLMGLIVPTSGEILIDNKSLHNSKYNKVFAWRNLISHVPQNIFLMEGSIMQNIAFGIPISSVKINDIKNAADLAKILEFIEDSKNGFNTIIGERGINLSGGQRQRIAIARAIYRKKPILILDEATSALDHNTEKSIINSLKNLSEKLTIISVSHRAQALEDCNHIIKVSKNNIEYIT